MSLAGIAAVVTVAGALIYILGLIALFWPIYTKLSNRDVSIALYAVSVISKTVVAGQGLRTFVVNRVMVPAMYMVPAALFGVLALGGEFWWLSDKVESWLRRSNWLGFTTTEDATYLVNTTVFIVGLFVPALLVIFAALLVRRVRRRNKRELTVRLPMHRVAFLLSSCFTSLVVIFTAIPMPMVGSKIPLQWATLVILATSFFVPYLWGASQAVSHYPPLPKVEITLTEENEIVGGEIIKGTLLDHSGGIWHFFDSRNDTLTAIPDGKVQKVRILK